MHIGYPFDQERPDASRDVRHFATRKNPRYYKSFAVPPPLFNDEEQVDLKVDGQSRI